MNWKVIRHRISRELFWFTFALVLVVPPALMLGSKNMPGWTGVILGTLAATVSEIVTRRFFPKGDQ